MHSSPLPVSPQISRHLEGIARAFHSPAAVFAFRSLGQGNINDTYLAVAKTQTFILQRINPDVFPRPRQVADNSALVSSCIINTRATDEDARQPRILQSRDGRNYTIDGSGGIWRAQSYIENSCVYETVSDPSRAFQVGRCLAFFHGAVEGLDPRRLAVVLPDFHNLPRYLQNFDGALLAASDREISAKLRSCLAAIARWRADGDFFQRAVARGDLSPQVIHGDPKVANVLFDRAGGAALALIDLDTVGEGLVLYDLGDCLRSCCCSTGENEYHREIQCDMEIVGAVLQGYLSRRELTRFEREHLFEALLLVSFELGVRFVTDYLRGNRYFKVSGPEDNLNRAMVQFQLVDSIAGRRQDIADLTLI